MSRYSRAKVSIVDWQKIRKELLATGNSMLKKFISTLKNAKEVTKEMAVQAKDTIISAADEFSKQRSRSKLTKQLERLKRESSAAKVHWSPENKHEVNSLLEKSEKSLSSNELGTATSEIEKVRKVCENANNEAKTRMEKEFKRQFVTNSVFDSLKELGFTHFSARLVSPNNVNSSVIVEGNKPSGESIAIILNIDGTVHTDFDGYSNKECTTDSERLLSHLKEKYSIEFVDIIEQDKPLEECETGIVSISSGSDGF